MAFVKVEQSGDGRCSIESNDWVVRLGRLAAKELAFALLWEYIEKLDGLELRDLQALMIAQTTGLCVADARRLAKSKEFGEELEQLLNKFTTTKS